MGKEIILPWSCNIGKKLMMPIGIAFTIVGVIGWILFFGNGGPKIDQYHFALFFDMLLGTSFGLALILFDCTENDRFPSFKCKSNDVSQKEST